MNLGVPITAPKKDIMAEIMLQHCMCGRIQKDTNASHNIRNTDELFMGDPMTRIIHGIFQQKGTMSVHSGFKIAAAYNKKTFMGHPAHKIIHGISHE